MATLGWLHRADGVILSTPNCVRLTAAFGVHPSRRGASEVAPIVMESQSGNGIGMKRSVVGASLMPATTERSSGNDRRRLLCDSGFSSSRCRIPRLPPCSNAGHHQVSLDGPSTVCSGARLPASTRRSWQRGCGDARLGPLALVATDPRIWLGAAVSSFDAMTFGWRGPAALRTPSGCVASLSQGAAPPFRSSGNFSP
jgi:hypothetical protein